MEEIVAKLLAESGYIQRSPTEPDKCDVYLNRELQDCIIICEYDLENLTNFRESTKTQTVMRVFEDARQHENISKNTSLVMPLKLTKFADYELIKNIVLSVEENPYAFRKYVTLFTDEGIKSLDTSGSLKKSLEAILLDPERFRSFEEGNADDEFRTVLELFVKLPFMNIRGIPSVELPEYINPLDLPENSDLRNIFIATNHIFKEANEVSLEDQINMLLGNELVQKFSKVEEKNREV